MAALYISIIVFLRFFQSYFSKRASILIPKDMRSFLKYNLFSMSVASFFGFAFVLLEMRTHALTVQLLDLVYSLSTGLSLVISTYSVMYVKKQVTVSLASLFSTAGIVIPIISGIFLFTETLSVLQLAALAAFLVASFLLVSSSQKIYSKVSFSSLLLLFAAMVSNGLVMLFQKLFSLSGTGTSASVFSFLTFSSAAILIASTLSISFIYKKIKGTNQQDSHSIEEHKFKLHKPQPQKKRFGLSRLYTYGFILSVAVFLVNQLSTISAALVPSILLFGISNGGATIITFLTGAAFFKENITWKSLTGVLLGVAAMLLMNIR